MAQSHYKLPLDDELDKDIKDWIDTFPRNKKGEVVRHAIRYYMEKLNESDGKVFLAVKSDNAEVVVPRKPLSKPNVIEEVDENNVPKLNRDNLK